MNLIEIMNNRIKAGQPFVLATIVRKKGSSPRSEGAKILVFPDGNFSGTIGGGKFEKLVIDDSVGLLKSSSQQLLKKYKFTGSGQDATGMACGGEAEVFMEVYARPNRLIIFGGGHIARDLVSLAAESEFKITIIDDRDDILQAYDKSVDTIKTDSEYQKDLPVLGSDCFIVIVTRSHVLDRTILENVIKHDCAYIGMIGSRAKIKQLFKSLEDSGVARDRLDKIYTPIGLAIGGEGPYEIAVSILAELIAVKNRAEKFIR